MLEQGSPKTDPSPRREEERTGLNVLLERVVMTWGSNLALFLCTTALFCLPLLAYSVLTHFVAVNPTIDQALTIILSTLVLTYTSAAAAIAIEEMQEARETSKGVVRQLRVRSDLTVGTLTARVMSHSGGLLPTALLSGALIYVGLILMYIPAIVPFVWTVFAGPIVVAEETVAVDAIQRGQKLIADGRWITMLIVAGVFALVGFLTNFIAPVFFKVRDLLTHNENTWQKILVQGTISLVDVALLSLWAVWIAIAFFDTVEELRKAKAPPANPARS